MTYGGWSGVRRSTAVASMAALLLSGCTYSREEPGLFRPPPSASASAPSSPSSPSSGDQGPPEATNPQLPVLGEQLWTTGDGLSLTIRFAVHAVRRIDGGTVLDWSVTPLPSGGREVGDPVPPTVDLGLRRDDNGDQRSYLIDSAGRVYRPLTHKSADAFHHCLCTPLWVAQLGLRIGETRMLQLVFAPLSSGVNHVDVSLANTMPFWHIPVMTEGTVPLARRSVDLARPADAPPALSGELSFTEPDDPLHRRRSVALLDLQSGPSGTALTWSVSSLEDQPFPAYSFGSPPVSTSYGARAGLRSTDVADGPILRPTGKSGRLAPLRAWWLTSEESPVPYVECLCSHFGSWGSGLRTAGGRVTVSTTYPPLPAGTRRVDVVLPGLGTVADVPVRAAAIDADREVVGTGRPIVRTWTYSTSNPPAGWLTVDWPSPVPDPDQLRDYQIRVDRLVDLPAR